MHGPPITSDSFVYQTDQGFNDNGGEAVEYENLPGDLTGKISGLTASGFSKDVVQFGSATNTLFRTAPRPGPGPIQAFPTFFPPTSISSVALTSPFPREPPSVLIATLCMSRAKARSPLAESGSPVTFTSINQIPGTAASTAQPGDWGGVDYQEGSAGSVAYGVFNFGGAGVRGLPVTSTQSWQSRAQHPRYRCPIASSKTAMSTESN